MLLLPPQCTTLRMDQGSRVPQLVLHPCGWMMSQGECNANRAEQQFYACAFPRFIAAWRAMFKSVTAFFGFETLPAYINDSGLPPDNIPFIRDAQLSGLSASGGRGSLRDTAHVPLVFGPVTRVVTLRQSCGTRGHVVAMVWHRWSRCRV